MTAAAERLVIALDVERLSQAVALAKQLQGLVRYVKIGSVLFCAYGPEAIRRLRRVGVEVFLDLKFYDIPSTVERSCRAVVRHRVGMLTVHASGEPEMLEAAGRAAHGEARRLGLAPPKVLGVTVLTSVRTAKPSRLTNRVVELARRARHAGLDGVVASAHEAAAIRRRVAPEGAFLIVCPGIRPSGAHAADQQRVATAHEAIARGADIVVVGRPVTQARRPRTVVEGLLEEMTHATRSRAC